MYMSAHVCVHHCAKSLLYDSVYLCVNLKNTQNITCMCSIFQVCDGVYSRIRKCQIRHRLYKHAFKIYDSVFLRVYIPVSYILLHVFHSIKSNCLHNKYTTELIHDVPGHTCTRTRTHLRYNMCRPTCIEE